MYEEQIQKVEKLKNKFYHFALFSNHIRDNDDSRALCAEVLSIIDKYLYALEQEQKLINESTTV